MKKSQLVFLLSLFVGAFSVNTAFADEIDDSNVINITVPTSVAIHKTNDGDVVVSDQLYIMNNSSSSCVKVDNVQVDVKNDWVLEAYGTDLSNEGSDSKKFALQLNGESVQSDGTVAANYKSINPGTSLNLSCAADIPRTDTIEEQIATVIFTVAIDTSDPEPEPIIPEYTVKDLTDNDEEIALWQYYIDSSTNTAVVQRYLGTVTEDLELVVPTSFNGAKTVSLNSDYYGWDVGTLKSLTIPRGINIVSHRYEGTQPAITSLTADELIIEGDCSITYGFVGLNVNKLRIGTNAAFEYSSKFPFRGSITTIESDSNIGCRAFENVSDVENIVFGPECKRIEESAFGTYKTIKVIEGMDNVEYIGSSAFSAFSDDFASSNLTISATVEKGAFRNLNCNILNLKGATLNGYLSDTATVNVLNMQDVTCSTQLFYSDLVVNTLNYTDNPNFTGLFKYDYYGGPTVENLILHADVTRDALFSNSKITNIIINSGCTSITSKAFYNDNSITDIKGLENLKTVGNHAFYDAFTSGYNLKDLQFGDATIGNYAFSGQHNIDSLTLNNCTVGDYAFSYNNSSFKGTLQNVVITDCTLGEKIVQYRDIENLTVLGNTSFTEGTFTDLIGTTNWYTQESHMTIKNITIGTDIPDKAFYWVSPQSVTLLEGCTAIGESAFAGGGYNADKEMNTYATLISLIGLENVRTIKNEAFLHAFDPSLTIETLELSNCNIGVYAFLGKNTINSLVLNNCTLDGYCFRSEIHTDTYSREIKNMTLTQCTLLTDSFTGISDVDVITFNDCALDNKLFGTNCTCNFGSMVFNNSTINANVLDGEHHIDSLTFDNCTVGDSAFAYTGSPNAVLKSFTAIDSDLGNYIIQNRDVEVLNLLGTTTYSNSTFLGSTVITPDVTPEPTEKPESTQEPTATSTVELTAEPTALVNTVGFDKIPESTVESMIVPSEEPTPEPTITSAEEPTVEPTQEPIHEPENTQDEDKTEEKSLENEDNSEVSEDESSESEDVVSNTNVDEVTSSDKGSDTESESTSDVDSINESESTSNSSEGIFTDDTTSSAQEVAETTSNEAVSTGSETASTEASVSSESSSTSTDSSSSSSNNAPSESHSLDLSVE